MTRRSESKNEKLQDTPGAKQVPVFNPSLEAYSVVCPYCWSGVKEPCTHTMLPGRPYQDEPHKVRVEYAVDCRPHL
jgi:hypothetical protein